MDLPENLASLTHETVEINRRNKNIMCQTKSLVSIITYKMFKKYFDHGATYSDAKR